MDSKIENLDNNELIDIIDSEWEGDKLSDDGKKYLKLDIDIKEKEEKIENEEFKWDLGEN
jgi:hypothetical protein